MPKFLLKSSAKRVGFLSYSWVILARLIKAGKSRLPDAALGPGLSGTGLRVRFLPRNRVDSSPG